MTTDAQYRGWIADASRDPYRRYLIEVAYSDDNTVAGHGRSNNAATLNPVQSLTVDIFANNQVDVLFSQPVVQEDYEWSVRINGNEVTRTPGGSYNFEAVAGTTYQIAVSSEKDVRYSIPWIVEVTYEGNNVSATGAADDWEQIGAGKGGDGTGMLYLSWPDSWISDTGKIYDDFIDSDIIVSRELANFNGIGDFYVINAAQDFNFDSVHWRGHACALLHGDHEWDREDYFQISENLIDGVRQDDGLRYKFDLMDSGQKYRGVMSAESIQNAGTVKSTLDTITDSEGFDRLLFAFLPEKREYSTHYEVQNTETVESIIRRFTKSIRADFSSGSFGKDFLVRRWDDYISLTLNEDHILEDTIRTVSSTPSAKIVRLNLANGELPVFAITDAKSGALRETVTIDTVLTNRTEAQEIAEEYAQYYSKTRYIRRLEVYYPNLLIANGLLVEIDHRDLQGAFKIIGYKTNYSTNVTVLELEDHDFLTSQFDFEPFIRVVPS